MGTLGDTAVIFDLDGTLVSTAGLLVRGAQADFTAREAYDWTAAFR